MNIRIIFAGTVSLLFISMALTLPSPCLEFKSRLCVRCPTKTHIFQNQCYDNIIGCLAYNSDNQCSKCDTTFTNFVNKTCVSFVSDQQLVIKTTPNASLGDQYGDVRFRFISLAQAQKDKYFILCDQFMRTGAYKHFISSAGQPIIAVSTFDDSSIRNYKILYEGNGAGLMMSLILINLNTSQIQLKSFVAISESSQVYQCVDYSQTSTCWVCKEGYHLQSNVCFLNIPNCISYIKNICLECKGFSLLVENKCISDCKVLKDTRSLRFYHGTDPNNGSANIIRAYNSQ